MEIQVITKEEIGSLLQASLNPILNKLEAISQANSPSPDSEKWISKQEAAKRLNVCGKTIDSYMKKGILPYSQFKSKLYIKPSDIQKILERHYVIKTN